MIREYSKYKPFRFWCQKVLPLVYDDSLSYYELLNKVVDYLNNVIKDVNALGTAFEELDAMVNDYFDNLDVQEEINNKLDSMAEDGTLDAMILPLVGDAVSEWLEDNVTPTGSAVVVDASLTISGASADAKVTGDEISDLKSDLDKDENNLYNLKNLLIADAKKIVKNKSYYSAEEHDSEYLSYAVIHMEANTVYVIVPQTRFITYDTGVEVNNPSANYEFTPSSERDVYITFYNDIETYGGWCVYKKSDVNDPSKLGTYQNPYPGNWLLGAFGHASVTAEMIDGFAWGNLKEDFTLLYENKYVYAGSSGVDPYTTDSQYYNTYELLIDTAKYTFSNEVRFLTPVGTNGKSISTTVAYAREYDNTSGDAVKLIFSIDKAYYPNIIISKGSAVKRTNDYPKWLDELCINNNDGIISRTFASMTAGDVKELTEIHNKKNAELILYADTSTGPNILFGQGRNGTIGSIFEITATKWYVYECINGTMNKLRDDVHNLTISNYVTIQIFVRENAHADIILGTSSGSIKIENVPWYGTSSKPYLKLISGTLTNVVFKYRMGDYDKPIYVYGDSYISLNTDQRWVYYVSDKNFNPWLLDGYGGRNSAEAIISFRNEMAIGKPRYILWALGMNDADSSSAINSTWKTVVDEVIAYCDANGIEIVLATIPCTPTVHNEYKNVYVKASGKRYIDFAKAVGGEEYGDTWYAGMLASDNVHPLAPGAVAMANRAIIDMPELCVK